jgi:hypothetical protein
MAQGAKPGKRRGGRQSGTTNKRTVAITDRLETLDRDSMEGVARLEYHA